MGYNKIKSIKSIVQLGLNIHRFLIPSTETEFYNVLKDMQHCTIRTDHEKKTEDLPFYVVNTKETSVDNIKNIWESAQQEKYRLIISDGIKYDSVQKYNLVTKIEKNGDFIFEASDLKIPLRHMYRHPLLSCHGNISDNIHEWSCESEKFGINKVDIKRDLEELYTYQLYGHWLETTKYPIKVGTKQHNIVFWQI